MEQFLRPGSGPESGASASTTTKPTERRASPAPEWGNLRQLVLLRTIAIAGQIVTVLFVSSVLDVALPLLPLAAAIGFLAVFNVATWLRLGLERPVSETELFGQILVDIAVFTALLYLAGGADNPFASMYLLNLTIAATMLPGGHAWSIAAVTGACYLLLTLSSTPLVHAGGEPVEHRLLMAGTAISFAITASLLAFFVLRITGALRAHERLLAQARESEPYSERIVQLGAFGLVRLLLAGGAVILLTGMLVVGTWVEKEIESGVINRAGLLTSLYVDSFVSPHLQSLAGNGELRETDRSSLDRLLSGTPLGRHIVAFKIWAPDGRIVYSTNPALIGRQFQVKPALAAAFAGEVRSQIADLSEPENELERPHWSRLIETYAPVRAANTGTVIAVSELYKTTEDLAQEVSAARLRSWLMVGTATLVMFLLLAALVRRASDTITAQQRKLSEKVTQLTALLAQNEQLHERVRRAAARTTALNERFLHRIAADLHDGPGQGLALALMRMETLADVCSTCPAAIAKDRSVGDEFRTLHSALQAALDDLRAVSGGLHLPEIEQLSLADTARRAVRDYERTAGLAVAFTVDGVPQEAPLPVKITLFRLLQESLANGFRHGGGVDQRVTLNTRDGQLLVEVADGGKGFDPRASGAEGHLGLAGMRERVETLGGTFSVRSAPDQGTVIRASLPLAPVEAEHE